MKFVCDEMLKRLGQWLRVAGYDVLILPDGTDDRVLLERAERDQRLLLSSGIEQTPVDRLAARPVQPLHAVQYAAGRRGYRPDKTGTDGGAPPGQQRALLPEL